ncbi:hypothetical protein ACFQY4_26005 [Catellatospora bangladeshensis]|uniref:hypothetical protein n=1 Tax=Catellatospora bangladeshensis TaxID=310355 RepID=UPI0036146FB8
MGDPRELVEGRNVTRIEHIADTAGGGLIVTPHGSLTWWSSRLSPIRPALIQLAPDVLVGVDMTDPRRVVSWTAPHADALALLRTLFGNRWHADACAALRQPKPPVTMLAAPPRLPDAWARFALAQGVRRWLPVPVDEATLAIDDALAIHLLGWREQARTEFATVSASLLDRVDGYLRRELPPGMFPDLRAATRAAAELLGSGHPDAADLAASAHQLDAAGPRLPSGRRTGAWPSMPCPALLQEHKARPRRAQRPSACGVPTPPAHPSSSRR